MKDLQTVLNALETAFEMSGSQEIPLMESAISIVKQMMQADPVAWLITSKKTDEKFVSTRPGDWNNVNWDKHPLYTAPQAVPAWLPIESAPKDGTDVITGHPGGSIEVLRWLEVKTNRRGWTDGECFALSWPTHWMSLPAPPKGTT